jgi:hypothetical protein
VEWFSAARVNARRSHCPGSPLKLAPRSPEENAHVSMIIAQARDNGRSDSANDFLTKYSGEHEALTRVPSADSPRSA